MKLKKLQGNIKDKGVKRNFLKVLLLTKELKKQIKTKMKNKTIRMKFL